MLKKKLSDTGREPDAAEKGRTSPVQWLRHVLVIGLWAAASRLLGLVRDLSVAWLVGSGALADALVAATVIPHAVRKMLADGILSMSVTASASAWMQKHGDVSFLSRKALGPVLSVLAGAAVLLLTGVFLAAPWLVALLAPGSTSVPGWTDLASGLLRSASLYFPAAVFAAFAMGILHARGCFSQASAAPVCFNTILLLFILPGFLGIGEPTLLIATGFSAAGLAQAFLLWHFLAAHERNLSGSDANLVLSAGRLRGYHSSAQPERQSAGSSPGCLQAAAGAGAALRKGLVQIPGLVFSASSMQLCILAAMAVVSLAGEGQMTALYFSDRLLELPVGIVGACMGIASVPGLSRLADRSSASQFLENLKMAMHFGLLFSLPAAAGLLAITPLLVSVLLGHGAFTDAGTELTVETLYCLIPSLPACVLLRPLIAAAHAWGMDRAARISTVFCVVLTLAAGLCLPLLEAGSFSLAGPCGCSAALWLQCFFLWVAVSRRAGAAVLGNTFRKPLQQSDFLSLSRICRMLVCGMAAGGSAFLVQDCLPFGRTAILLVSCLTGAACWAFFLRMLCPQEFSLLLLHRRH